MYGWYVCPLKGKHRGKKIIFFSHSFCGSGSKVPQKIFLHHKNISCGSYGLLKTILLKHFLCGRGLSSDIYRGIWVYYSEVKVQVELVVWQAGRKIEVMSESDSNRSYESEVDVSSESDTASTESSSDSAAVSTESSGDSEVAEIAPYSYEPSSSASGSDNSSSSEESESDSEPDRLIDTSW